MLEADTSENNTTPPIIVIENDDIIIKEEDEEKTFKQQVQQEESLEESQLSFSEKSESTLPPDDASSNSTITPDSSSNDDTKPLFMDENDFMGPVIDFYKHKNILMTGATGFIGKAVLWKLIKALRQDIGQIYILIRSGSNKRTKIGRPLDRIRNEILNNKAFVILRRMMGKDIFDEIVKTKIIPISGNLISPDLSLSEQDKESIVTNVNVVIHCAATLDYSERLDLALETNTLGTLRMIDLADECKNMEAFVHMSLAYTDPNLPEGHIQERVYQMQLDDPERLLSEIVNLELPDIPKMTQRILEYYPNTYTFTKSLTEHLILKRVDANRIEQAQGGKVQWPVAIVRATQVGAGLFEPLPGWVDGVTGTNGAVFLMGKGIQVFPPDMRNMLADIVPVDYLTRVILGSAATMAKPGHQFILPYNEILDQHADSDSINMPNIEYFPYIYQVSASAYAKTSWNHIYESVRVYWSRNSKLTLPNAPDYFAANRSLFKAKFFMKYQLPQTISSVVGKNNVDANLNNRTIELASRVVESSHPFLRHRWIFDHYNVLGLQQEMEQDTQFSLNAYKKFDWDTYMINYSYGVHSCIAPLVPEGLRNITVPEDWACALYVNRAELEHSILDKQIESVIFSASDIQKRTERMLTELINSLEKPGQDTKDKKKMEEWVNDFDASLDDWCHDDSNLLKDTKNMVYLGHWINPSESHEEHITIEVLNDRRVGRSIRQIIESSGVPQKTVVSESLKILQRTRERTQLAYIWSAGAFLNTLFKRLFSSLRVCKKDIERVKEQIQGKNVVYVPVSKTIIDQLLLWYICLRYELPVPAIVCDEALALLGPISDILRITGAYFVRRDRAARSPLNTAVTAAYTEVILKEHGAISMVIERARSRTGRLQTAFHDGMINMVIEATEGKNQFHPNQNQNNLNQSNQTEKEKETASLLSPTGSFSSLNINRETVFIPVNITYEKIPELRALIDQVLDQKPRQLTVSSTFLRPSAAVADRVASKEPSGVLEKGKYGRAYVGFGQAISVSESVKESTLSKRKRASTVPVKDDDLTADFIARKIQRGQHEAAVVSPVSLVAATLLFGRVTGGIPMGKLNKHVSWLREEVLDKGVNIDWQNDEEISTIVSYSLHLLDARNNITMDGKRITDQTIIRVVEHADNVMDLSYMASQLIEIFLPEALFSVVYLAGTEKKVSRRDLLSQFTFLVRLFKHEFIYPWNREEKFDILLKWFVKKNLLIDTEDGSYEKVVTVENNEEEYTRVCLLASFIYPTLDAYWVTSCSLSALRDLPFMPRKIVPVLSQWIAAHLITGRRTVYREVLSTEASQNAVDNFLAIGFIDAVHPKQRLSPDAQILLLELGVTTSEDLVMVSDRENVKDEFEPEESFDNILLNLQDIASLCHEIEKFRHVTDAVNLRNNAQVFDKCQNQIRSILRSDNSYATQHGMKLAKEEDQMIQLVYSLKVASTTPVISDDGNAKHSRRVSQAYNLKSV